MGQSPSDSSGGALRLWISGFLKSTHALIFALIIACLVLFGLAAEEYPIVAYGVFGLFTIVALAVVGRYALKGPEVDRAQPMLSFSHQQFQILNVEPKSIESLVKYAIKHRQALPAPTGIIIGSAADPESIQLLPPDLAEQMRLQDSAIDQSEEPDATESAERDPA